MRRTPFPRLKPESVYHGLSVGFFVLMLLFCTWPAAADPPIQIRVDEQVVESPVPPIIVGGRTLVPVRVVTEAMGAEVSWEPATRMVTVQRGPTVLNIWIDSAHALVNQQAVPLDVPAMLLENRTMVPMRFIAESLGYAVHWSDEERVVHLRSQKQITAITLGDDRIDISASAPLQYRAHHDLGRIMLDFEDTTIAPGVVEQLLTEGTFIRSVHVERPDERTFDNQIMGIQVDPMPGRMRVGIALTSAVRAEAVLTADQKELRIRIPHTTVEGAGTRFPFADGQMAEVAVAQEGEDALVLLRLPAYFGHSLIATGEQREVVVEVVTSPVYKRRIWVDAGHGGSDPGTQGTTYGLVERDVNLAVALALQRQLELAGALVYMTRTGYHGISFEERPALVNAVDPPIEAFVSIHHNAMPGKPEVSGIETYYYTDHSRELAERIHGAVVEGLGLPDRGVRTQSFRVIKYTQAPSVLVELGYMTSPVDEQQMAHPEYAERAATAIRNGLFRYFAAQTGSVYTLASVAARFAPGDRAIVNTGGDALNVRLVPSTSADIIGQVAHGDVVQVIGVEGDWVRIMFGPRMGYVYGEYLQRMQ